MLDRLGNYDMAPAHSGEDVRAVGASMLRELSKTSALSKNGKTSVGKKLDGISR